MDCFNTLVKPRDKFMEWKTELQKKSIIIIFDIPYANIELFVLQNLNLW